MKKIYKIIFAGLILIGVTNACSDFDELNTNPNSPSTEKVSPASVLASSMRKAFHEDRFEFWRGVVLHAERFAAHLEGGYSGCWWNGNSSYTYSEDWTAATWSSYNSNSNNGYGGPLFANLKILLDYYANNPDEIYASEYVGIANTIRAFQFLKISDLFGDIPYTEHGNIEIPSPAYDSQQDIYNDLEAILKKMVEENLNSDVNISSLDKFDLVYSGNVRKWQKFANALRLRMALRRSMADPNGASQILASIVQYPLPESNADNLRIARTKSTVDLQNQYYGFFKTWPGNLGGETYSWDGYNLTWGPGPGAFIPAYAIIEYMKGSELYASEVNASGSADVNINPIAGIYDPRIDKYFMPPKGNASNEHKGMPARAIYMLDNGTITSINSHPAEGNVKNYSWMHPSIWYDGGTWDPVSLDYAEVCLALAEATERDLISYEKTAAEWLSEGLQASCERWDAELGSFADDVVAKYNAASDEETKLEILYVERWISAYTVPHQAWSIVRRAQSPEFCYLDRDMKLTGNYVEADGSVTSNKELARYAEGSTNFVLPQRMRIPESEQAVNSNVPEANKAMSNKVWWANY